MTGPHQAGAEPSGRRDGMKAHMLVGIVCLLVVLGSCDKLKAPAPPTIPIPKTVPPSQGAPLPEAEHQAPSAPVR